MKSLWWRQGAVVLWLLWWRNAAGSSVQFPVADRLRAEVQAHAQPDTARVHRLNALALVLRNNAPEESAALFQTALTLAQRLGYPAGMPKRNSAWGSTTATVTSMGWRRHIRNRPIRPLPKPATIGDKSAVFTI